MTKLESRQLDEQINTIKTNRGFITFTRNCETLIAGGCVLLAVTSPLIITTIALTGISIVSGISAYHNHKKTKILNAKLDGLVGKKQSE